MPSDNPFDRSLDLLLALAIKEMNADQCSLYEYSPFNESLIRQRRLPRGAGHPASETLPAPAWLSTLRDPDHIVSGAHSNTKAALFPDVADGQFEAFLILPLVHAEKLIGLATFAWRQPTELRERDLRSAIEFASAISQVAGRATQSSFAIHLANRISQLQAELANGKIADRARGILLEDARRFGAGEVVRQHVSRVLESADVLVVLQDHLKKLESEVRDRHVIGKAKEILQTRLALSEEQAYLQLRNTSRKSRRRLLDVADEVLRSA